MEGEINLKQLKEQFREIFGYEGESIIFSPGRINIIGEHIDYNGGNVFPAAIQYGTYIVYAKRKDQQVRVYSANFSDEGIVTFIVDDIKKSDEGSWVNFPKGMIQTLAKNGYQLQTGVDIFVYGTIPNGAGLSSSASLEMAMGLLISEVGSFNIPRLDLVKYAKEAENDYIGVQCGIMDMFAIGMGKKDRAILLNCDTLDYKYAPFNLGEYRILIMNTNKRRELADSKYNERREECEEALKRIQAIFEIDALCELKEYELPQVKRLLENEVYFKRVKHVVTEQARTAAVMEALNSNDLHAVGKLLNASHASLKDDYEVTGLELDTVVELAVKQKGVLGARMTGAGFGGCAIAIVSIDDLEDVKNSISEEYQKIIGYAPTFYETEIVDGTMVVS